MDAYVGSFTPASCGRSRSGVRTAAVCAMSSVVPPRARSSLAAKLHVLSQSAASPMSRQAREGQNEHLYRAADQLPCVLCYGGGSVRCFDCHGKGVHRVPKECSAAVLLQFKGGPVQTCSVCAGHCTVPCPVCLRTLYKEVRSKSLEHASTSPVAVGKVASVARQDSGESVFLERAATASVRRLPER